MAAALLRLLPRRRAATLAPLLPAASMSSCSKPRCPLRAVAATGGLPDVRRAQLFASPVPSMLRLYATEGCARPAPRQPAHHQATCCLHNQKGRKDSQHCVIIPWFCDKVVKDLREQRKMIAEAFQAFEKADCLLEEGLDDEALSMFDQGTDDFLKALAICEKGLDDLVKVVGSCDQLTLATREDLRESCKGLEDNIKILRQRVKKLSAGFKTIVALRKSVEGYLPRMGSQGLEDV